MKLDLQLFENTKMNYAFQILAHLQNDLDFSDNKLMLEAFDNCREQGFVIHKYSTSGILVSSLYFSENRNSDQIVVYFDEFEVVSEVNPHNHPINWNGEYFSYGEFEKAANYIKNILDNL